MGIIENTIMQAKKVSAEALQKIKEANEAMDRLRDFKDQIDKEHQDLTARKQTIEVMEKRLKYMQLRINKLIDEKQLDAELKQMIQEAMSAEVVS